MISSVVVGGGVMVSGVVVEVGVASGIVLAGMEVVAVDWSCGVGLLIA